jgi:hypothetical protein
MKKVIILVVFLISVAIFLTSKPSQSMDMPLSQDIKIIYPTSDVPKEIATFSGMWERNWDGMLDAELIVEEISSN